MTRRVPFARGRGSATPSSPSCAWITTVDAGIARVLCGLATLSIAAACGGSSPPATGSGTASGPGTTSGSAPAAATRATTRAALPRANVLLVTIDTLRADHVGAYGSTRGATPTLDRLAAEGLRVETTYAHVPLTLPSHTALMTGTYPFVNGVRDNGSFRFDGTRPTLAATLKAAGYRTGAFVSAFVLDARFGLNAGFDVYDDRFGSRSVGGDLSVLERTADVALAAATTWIEGGNGAGDAAGKSGAGGAGGSGGGSGGDRSGDSSGGRRGGGSGNRAGADHVAYNKK